MNKYLQIEGVDVVFETRKQRFVALQDIDLSVARGEFIAIIGHSGCGKSTLLNLVAGLLEPTRGGLILAGRE
ncbi:MAG TPA: ATP-binding cassette domain-containing protein, partial [Methylococcus sp.]|nr:ATP-binding cassette domain-containing protein [Methylococcus sp.]